MIRYRSEPNSPVVEIAVEGHVGNDELAGAIARLRDDLEQNGKSRVIEIIEGFTGLEPRALWTDVRLGLPLARKVSRVAVVADQAWIRGASHLGRFFTSAEIRVFEVSELNQARAWITRDAIGDTTAGAA